MAKPMKLKLQFKILHVVEMLGSGVDKACG